MKNKGVSLIALVVTIIVLLILAGVALTATLGSNGLIAQAKFSKWTTEFRMIEEAEQIEEVKKSVKAEKEEDKYVIKGSQISIASNSSLEKTIKVINGDSYVPKLYEIDISALKLKKGTSRQYAIDINDGTIYDVLGYELDGAKYNIPEIGVDSEGNIVKNEYINNKEENKESGDTEPTENGGESQVIDGDLDGDVDFDF